ncbi:MAG: formylmethanofuran--tetrahydromethanopterin N-formyltransferase [Planctomycetales bacterium]|nr:formylmethanofuran--tetrahydromethanopterin N-formyltransferase [Planctomycetales bacterium]NIM09821.1 formylmethanofuran--tetrahydromethanopterin N-formyltransferase [Planctomycetales bacterium]NIN09290.1 formylmethanofuran--tetrahydromethanopterin N-formyltransferase [Planctomycetales bacterium]NIN78393.1 formylmethanofuran--tetrahydromethanopterin N-formyltransferase [Planctomycetales bacterium]NIO35571.1 formylmethanofuran--tetrahydromethanopterin N-formyltransferase [Planctomycetales ba
MEIRGTQIVDTFAEAFGMRFVRLTVTAHDEYWLEAALREFTGYGSSVIACDAEVGVERRLSADQTPDGRPGASVLVFGFSREVLAQSVPNRTGQCLMTCPTTAVYDGLIGSAERIAVGKQIRFFGDGFQKSKLLFGRRYWRIPVMDGEFLVEDRVGVAKGVAGGNIVIQGRSLDDTLAAARRGTEAVDCLDDAITPFPAGVARSGSKVGSVYKQLKASTADAFCPTLRGRVASKLHDEAGYALEIVVDGASEAAVARAMASAIRAAAGEGVVAIGAGNYGGKLGKYHFHLHKLLA